MKRIIIIVWTTAIALALSTNLVSGQAVSKTANSPDTRPRSQIIFQGRGGIVFGGDLNQGGQKFSASAGYSLVAGIEFPSRSAASSGFELDLHQINSDQQLWTISVAIRRALKNGSSGTLLRPGIALGYGRSAASNGFGGSGMFVVRGFLELDIVSGKGYGFCSELGVIGDPFGQLTKENSGSSLSIGFRPIIRVGLLFW